VTIFTHIGLGALNVGPFLFVRSLVVVFHEMGHFLAGRWRGVNVDAFSLGFGPALFAFVDRRDTRWRVGALPLGGYVKFHGDFNAASRIDGGTAAARSPVDRAVSFFGQKVRTRAAIVAAGPIGNFGSCDHDLHRHRFYQRAPHSIGSDS
jgi:regulator of sigma E protease